MSFATVFLFILKYEIELFHMIYKYHVVFCVYFVLSLCFKARGGCVCVLGLVTELLYSLYARCLIYLHKLVISIVVILNV